MGYQCSVPEGSLKAPIVGPESISFLCQTNGEKGKLGDLFLSLVESAGKVRNKLLLKRAFKGMCQWTRTTYSPKVLLVLGPNPFWQKELCVQT